MEYTKINPAITKNIIFQMSKSTLIYHGKQLKKLCLKTYFDNSNESALYKNLYLHCRHVYTVKFQKP